MRAVFVAIAVLGLVAVAGSAGDDGAAACAPLTGDPAAFAANDNHVGVIDLYVFGAQGATVSFYECTAGRAVALGVRSQTHSGGYTPMYAATTWSCTRRTRRFAVTVPLADGSVRRGLTDIRTPSCARRLRVEAPARAAAGRLVAVALRDRWGLGGLATRWCVRPPAGRARCRAVRFAVAQRAARRSFVPDRRGRWRVTLSAAAFSAVADVAVGVRSGPEHRLPRVLATGDSTMQGVDIALADELAGRAEVISDVHPGTGLSIDASWQALAVRQARRHARAVVLSIGADEGWPMVGPDGVQHQCCDAAWIAEYARRMRAVLATYRRHARVVVLTVVAPRDPARAAIVAAARTAIVRVAAHARGVRLLRMDALFSPAGYQETVRYRGRDVAVREPDGVHLNVAGTVIEAREAVPAVRAALRAPRARRTTAPSG